MIDISVLSDFILDAFEVLGRRTLSAGSLDAKRVPGRTDTFIAVSQSRELYLLLEVDQSTFVAERHFRAIQVLSGDDFSIVEADSDEIVRRRFAVITLRPGHENLTSSFAVVAATLLATLADAPTASDVIEFLDSLVDLVAPRRVAAAATVVGLWGELWMITSAADPMGFASAWHSESADRFDFSFPRVRIEVKTTTGSGRIHEFGLEQLEAGKLKPTLIASLAIVNDSNGETVVDLLDKLSGILSGSLAARVNRIALQTVAGDIESVQDYAFAPFGPDPLVLFDSQSIPRVLVPSGVGISGVRFSADLDRVAPIARAGEYLVALLER